MSEFNDISATRDRGDSEVPDDVTVFYTVTAVDDDQLESVRSTEFCWQNTALDKQSSGVWSRPHTLPEAMVLEPYGGSIAGTASDPESNQL